MKSAELLLPQRTLQVAKLLDQSLSRRVICERLGMGHYTLRDHVRAIRVARGLRKADEKGLKHGRRPAQDVRVVLQRHVCEIASSTLMKLRAEINSELRRRQQAVA